MLQELTVMSVWDQYSETSPSFTGKLKKSWMKNFFEEKELTVVFEKEPCQ